MILVGTPMNIVLAISGGTVEGVGLQLSVESGTDHSRYILTVVCLGMNFFFLKLIFLQLT